MDNAVIVACATLKDELELVMKSENLFIPIEWIDSGLHTWPKKLHERVIETIDNLPTKFTTVLLLFGFCGNSMVGVKANRRRLVLPIVADCIPIFLGSKQKQAELGAYTYFFTGGYLNSERTIITEIEDMKKRYGETRASSYAKKMLAHYKQISIIDTGAYELSPVFDKVKTFASEMELPVNTVNGSLLIIKNLLTGNWCNDDFLVVEPGEEITFIDSLSAGKSQI